MERVVSWLAVALAEAAQRVGPAAAGRPARLISEPSAIVNIVFGAVTDAKQRPGFPADPPLRMITAPLSLARD